MAALGICMHKILRIVYGMLKHNKPFDPQIDVANQQQCDRIDNVSRENETQRRFQTYDANAPVSRRQRKRKLERERSNSFSDTKFGITAPVPSTT